MKAGFNITSFSLVKLNECKQPFSTTVTTIWLLPTQPHSVSTSTPETSKNEVLHNTGNALTIVIALLVPICLLLVLAIAVINCHSKYKRAKIQRKERTELAKLHPLVSPDNLPASRKSKIQKMSNNVHLKPRTPVIIFGESNDLDSTSKVEQVTGRKESNCDSNKIFPSTNRDDRLDNIDFIDNKKNTERPPPPPYPGKRLSKPKLPS